MKHLYVQLQNAIDKAKIDLQWNWKGKAEEKPSEAAFNKAIEYLTNMWDSYRDEGDTPTFYPPQILPGPHNSIDLHWKHDSRKVELRINFPATNQPPEFRGIDAFGGMEERQLPGEQEYVFAARWYRYADS
jgi:hypothetical protein